MISKGFGGCFALTELDPDHETEVCLRNIRKIYYYLSIAYHLYLIALIQYWASLAFGAKMP
jgi:hypothetical protein